MKNLIQDFGYLPLEQKFAFALWCVCVVCFYSSVIYGVSSVLVKQLKRN